jgi:hypothetical protein
LCYNFCLTHHRYFPAKVVKHALRIPPQFPVNRLPQISILSCALFIRDFSFLKCRKFQSVHIFCVKTQKRAALPILRENSSIVLAL